MTTFDEVLYENNLSKIGISQFKEGYIIGFIINKIYIFNIEGDLEYISSPLINNQLSCHFTVGIDSFFNNKYYYLIGLLYSNKIYLKYYSYTPSSRTNYLYASEIFTDENYDYLNNYYLILNNGLTCDILNYKTEDLITCMYFVYYGPQKILLSHSKYMLYEGQIYYEYSSIYYEWDNAMLIKSIPGSHNSEAFYQQDYLIAFFMILTILIILFILKKIIIYAKMISIHLRFIISNKKKNIYLVV